MTAALSESTPVIYRQREASVPMPQPVIQLGPLDLFSTGFGSRTRRRPVKMAD